VIRDKRTWILVNAVGAALALYLLISSWAFPPQHPLPAHWLVPAGAALLLGLFIYSVVLRMRGPIRPAPWASKMSDRQLWIVKGALAAIVIAVSLVFALR
jgi:hypothetical protein